MGKGRNPNSLKNLKPVKPGEVRNPEGGRSHTGIRAVVKKLTREEISRLIELVMSEDVDGLLEIAKSKTETALMVAFASCMVKAINKGDYQTINSMLERVAGKVKSELDVTSGGEKIEPQAVVHVYLPANGRTKEENQE